MTVIEENIHLTRKITKFGVYSYEKSKNWLIFRRFLVLKLQMNASVNQIWRPIDALSPNLVTLGRTDFYSLYHNLVFPFFQHV